MDTQDTFDMLMKIAKAQSGRFPEGDDPFKIGCRILEEGGEVV